jgi:hypothetical protein
MDNSQNRSKSSQKQGEKTLLREEKNASFAAPAAMAPQGALAGLWCPNCGAALEGRKCKLFCPTPGCGYLVTCSEW